VIYAFVLRIPRLGRFQLDSVKITDKVYTGKFSKLFFYYFRLEFQFWVLQ